MEIDTNANFIYGKFTLSNAYSDAALAGLNADADFSNYELNLGANGGYRFNGLGAENFSLKPFVGVQLYYDKQGEFTQNGGLNLTSDAYSDFAGDILAGVEARYIFDNGGFVFAKASYEQRLFNSRKEVFMRVDGANGGASGSGSSGGELRFENETFNGFFAANVGGRVLSLDKWKLDLEAQYKRYDNGLNYFGGNLSVRYAF